MALLTRLVLLLLLVGCGDPLVDGEYLGEPIFRFPADVTSPAHATPGEHHVTLGLFWNPLGPVDTPPDELVEQTSESRRVPTPHAFSFDLRDLPPPALLHTNARGASWGVARILGYDDRNANGKRDEGEPFTAAASDRVLLYAPQPLSADDAPTGSPLVAGYSLTGAGLPCRPLTRQLGHGECDVPFGDACREDADCGAGQCTTHFEGPWPGGACTLRVASGGCRPRNAAYVGGRDGALWVAACKSTDDCARGPAYQCDMQTLACLPVRGVHIAAGTPVTLSPACKSF